MTCQSSPPRSALSTFLSTHHSSNDTQPAPATALPLEILHNLHHQHRWTELRLHHRKPSTPPTQTPTPRSRNTLDLSIPSHPDVDVDLDLNLDTPVTDTNTPPPPPPPSQPVVTLISGRPPRPVYMHPDLQRKLLRAGISLEGGSSSLSSSTTPPPALEPEREWVVPTTLAKKWTLRELCAVFDSLPQRPRRVIRGAMTGAETEAETVAVEHQDVKRVLMAMKAHEGLGGDGTVMYYIVQEGEVKPRQN